MSQQQTLRTGGIAAAREYQNLPAWQKAIALAEHIYKVTEDFPEREIAGLALHMRTTALGIPSALAAASAKANEHGMFASYQLGQSLAAELTTQLTLAQRLGYIAQDSEVTAELDEVNRLIVGLKHGLKIEAKDSERKERTEAREERDRKPYGDRGDRPHKKRDGGDRPYQKREEGGYKSQEERQYKKRDDRGGDRPYKKREDGERKPYAGGERKPYAGGDRPYKKREGGDRPYKARDDRGPRKPYRDKE